MATVTSKLTLTSADLLSQNLNISVSKSITVDNTTGLARKTITSTAKGTAAGQVTLHRAADYAAPAYLYVKNTDSTVTDHVIIYDATTSGNPILLLLKAETVLLGFLFETAIQARVVAPRMTRPLAVLFAEGLRVALPQTLSAFLSPRLFFLHLSSRDHRSDPLQLAKSDWQGVA